MSEHSLDRALRPARHEPRDVSFMFMAVLLAGIGSVLLALMGLAYVMFPSELQDRRFAQPFPAYPAPQLQPSPPGDMKQFYAEEMQRLNGVGWQDQAAGIVHIPIDQAMHDIAAEGIPGWPAGSATASLGDRGTAP